MPTKTHKTAVVLIPPAEVWEPIQQIRRRHDRQVRRWMPHVTLIYPFRPVEQFEGLSESLHEACRSVQPFEVRLEGFGRFHHGRAKYTIWLDPAPADGIRQLQAVLQAVTPDCDDVARHGGGFTPHLSVGQVRGRRNLERLMESLRADWRPVSFAADRISLIRRGDPPQDVFEVDRTFPLGP